MARGEFNSRIGTFAAVAGSVVGLGNLWRFPYLAGENGGFAFLLVYVCVSLLVSLPVMLSEFSIGRSQQCNAMRAFRRIAPGPWYLIGFLGVVTAYVIDSFYMVVGGWSLEFLRASIMDEFSGKSSEEIKSYFDAFLAGGTGPVLQALTSLGIATVVVFFGVSKGIERFNKLLMPSLFVLLLILVYNSLFCLPKSSEGIEFLFKPDFEKIEFHTVLTAMGQSFFSLSLGMGAMLTYGSYIRPDRNLTKTALGIVGFDSMVAILSGMVIFPAVFSFGIEPTQGPTLLFNTMPNIFQQMTGGHAFSILFFLLVYFAAVTSQVSLLEVVVAFASEEFRIARWKVTLGVGLTMALTGTMCALSQAEGGLFVINGTPLFDLFDSMSSNYMLPIGGFFIVLFAGWIMPSRVLRSQLTNNVDEKRPIYYIVLRFLMRYVSPAFVAIMFLNLVGFI